jgi:hypothetical protein
MLLGFLLGESRHIELGTIIVRDTPWLRSRWATSMFLGLGSHPQIAINGPPMGGKHRFGW